MDCLVQQYAGQNYSWRAGGKDGDEKCHVSFAIKRKGRLDGRRDSVGWGGRCCGLHMEYFCEEDVDVTFCR